MNAEEVALVKGMLARGDLHMDIATYFQVNQARISEIKTGKRIGKRYRSVQPAPPESLPPKGPYVVVSKMVHDEGVVAASIVRELEAILSRYKCKVAQ